MFEETFVRTRRALAVLGGLQIVAAVDEEVGVTREVEDGPLLPRARVQPRLLLRDDLHREESPAYAHDDDDDVTTRAGKRPPRALNSRLSTEPRRSSGDDFSTTHALVRA